MLIGHRADTHLAQCMCIMASCTTVYVCDAIMCTSVILSTYAYDCDHIPYVYVCDPMYVCVRL